MSPLITAVLLYVYVGVFAPGASSRNRGKILLISVGIFALEFALRRVPGLGYLAMATPLVSAVAIWLALEHWCAIERKPALKAAGATVATTFLIVVIWVIAFGGGSA